SLCHWHREKLAPLHMLLQRRPRGAMVENVAEHPAEFGPQVSGRFRITYASSFFKRTTGKGAVRLNDLKQLIREVADYPKPGSLFYDLTTLLKDKAGFHALIDRLCDHYQGHTIDVVAGIEARGFIFAPALAYRLGAGFVPVRKPKKLPAKTAAISY